MLSDGAPEADGDDDADGESEADGDVGALDGGAGAGGGGGGAGAPADSATAARQAAIDDEACSTIQGNPAASKSVPKSAPWFSR